MADWHIIVEDKDFSKAPADEAQPPGRSLWRRWSLLIGSMAVTVLIFGYITLQERLKSQAAVREDLTALISREEALRLAGNRTEAEALIAADAPQAWRNAYWKVFEADNPPPAGDFIQLKKIDFEGRCAVVEIDSGGTRQVRTYCLYDRYWQRAPLPGGAWGYGQTTLNFPNGASLHFLPRDQAFATALAADLSEFFKAVTAHLGEQPVYQGLAIRIEPHDLHEPLVLDDERRIIVNSPWLLPLNREAAINSGEARVRLTLAKTLLHRTNPSSAQLPSNLPGVVRFLQAAETISARHLMPRLERGPTPDDSRLTSMSAAYSLYHDSFYLMAADIYGQCGLQTLLDIVQGLPDRRSWDDLRQHPLKHSSFILANEAVAGEAQRDRGQGSATKDVCTIASDNEKKPLLSK